MPLLACPASLKGVLTAVEAASALAAGMRLGGAEAVELPIADGGEGTAEVFQRVLGGEWREAAASDPFGRPVTARYLVLADGTAIVECAEAVGLARLARGELDPLRVSSAGLGELLDGVLAGAPTSVVVCLGGSATVDGGAGLLASLPIWPRDVPLQVACDVRNPLLGERGAARVFGPQKGASPDDVDELERRLARMEALEPYRDLPGAGAAGGLGAALASLGGDLVSGADLVLDLLGFEAHAREATLVVTGEGMVDDSTFEGKAPGTVLARCQEFGIRSVLFGGHVQRRFVPGVDVRSLSGNPMRAREDLTALGVELARASER